MTGAPGRSSGHSSLLPAVACKAREAWDLARKGIFTSPARAPTKSFGIRFRMTGVQGCSSEHSSLPKAASLTGRETLPSAMVYFTSQPDSAIYAVQQPAVNMCYPPLTWQTYDIDFTAAHYGKDGKKIKNARITVRHNGVVIQDDVEIPRGTPGHHDEGPGADDLYLQGHGNPVVFRNVWVVQKK